MGAEKRVFLVQCSPIGGRSDHRLGLIQDITKMKQMQAQVAQEGKLAAIGRLAAGVAHELNNPLAAVASSAEILAGRVPTGDAARSKANAELQCHLGRIEKNVYRCKQIIDNLLDFARRPGEQFERVDLRLVLDDVHDLVAASARARCVLLTFSPPASEPGRKGPAAAGEPDAHGGGPELTLGASRGHSIRQLLVNLLLNAIDATAKGGRVAVDCARKDGGVELTVSDTGHGMAPEISAHVFEPFFTTRPVGQGTGLGLYLCHQMVEALHGRIRFESKPGAGTVFRVWLPGDSRLEQKRAAAAASSPVPVLAREEPLLQPAACSPQSEKGGR